MGEVRVRRFKDWGSGMKGERLRCVDVAVAERGQVMDWAQRVERDGMVGPENSDNDDIAAVEDEAVGEMEIVAMVVGGISGRKLGP